MAKYGILADAQWCSGCHSCEVACQMEHGLPVGETGIKVVKIGPWAIGDEADENWQFSYLPIPTKQCDTCAARRGLGKVPTCVQHCQSQCLEFGPLDVLSLRLEVKQKRVLVVAKWGFPDLSGPAVCGPADKGRICIPRSTTSCTAYSSRSSWRRCCACA